MRRIKFYFLSISFLGCALFAQSQSIDLEKDIYVTPEEKVQFLMALAEKYNTDALAILKSDTRHTFLDYVRGDTRDHLLYHYNTVIHETAHGYQTLLWEGGSKFHRYFISNSVDIDVPQFEVYESTELNKVVPSEAQENIFRYKTYIGGTGAFGNEISSIKTGIFGLLEEYLAYYHANNASYELFPYYQEIGADRDGWIDFQRSMVGTIESYYEFRLFIAWYLKYARIKYPEMYRALMNNKSLRAVYTIIDDKYEDLMNKYQAVGPGIVEELEKNGYKAEYEEDNIIIYKETPTVTLPGDSVVTILTDELSSKAEEEQWKIIEEAMKDMKNNTLTISPGYTSYTSYPTKNKEMRYLKSLFNEEDLAILNAFRITGANEGNYKDYLK